MKGLLSSILFLPLLLFAYTDSRWAMVFNRHILAGLCWQASLLLMVQSCSATFIRFMVSLFFYLAMVCLISLAEKISGRFIIGGADLKILALILFSYGYLLLAKSVLIASILVILRFCKCYMNKNFIKSLAFVPYLTFSLAISLILQA